MNSVIIHFKGPSYEEIESRAKDIKIIDGSCSSEEGENFQFWRYEDYKTEYAPEEKSIVENSIGGKPTASFQLLCRTSCGRFALDKMIKLFSSLNWNMLILPLQKLCMICWIFLIICTWMVPM